MLLLPKPTDFAVDFPTVARSVAFGIVFREFTTTLNPMATLEVVETSSPERQSGIISRYTIAPNIISKPTLYQNKS